MDHPLKVTKNTPVKPAASLAHIADLYLLATNSTSGQVGAKSAAGRVFERSIII